MVGRIPVIDVMPLVDRGQLPAKATVGEPLPVTATVFREGHDRLGAEVVLIGPDGVRRPPVRMQPLPLLDRHSVDRHQAWVTPDQPGAWAFEIHAWSDPVATWQHDAGIKIRAEVDVELMLAEGRLLLERVLAGLDAEVSMRPRPGARATRPTKGAATAKPTKGAATAKPTKVASAEAARPTDQGSNSEREILEGAIAAAGDTTRPVAARLAQLESPELAAVLLAHPLRELVTVEGPFPAYADRSRALFSSWYEFFPRSEGALVDPATGTVVSGSFRTAAKRLEAVAAMGFDVVYLPPIHPIGEVNRKGPNNTVMSGPSPAPLDWPGSPWAIGSRHGGHDAIHPELGTLADFDAFVAEASRLGLEVALDLALQCAPDHPWVAAHPEWFTTRADGTIAFAENPPKKYQDIYPVSFDNDPTGINQEVLRVVRHWMAHGVRIFRVDNPHTKPVPFWQWLLAEIRGTDPDVLFLSEAFTKPPMLQTLGAIGFHQSYTYFTWRTDKEEIADYLEEVSHESDHRIRPNFFVNTPDILHEFLQYGGPPAFKIRAVLAAMGSPNWGVYSGYELFEHVAVRPGSEEYLDSEKYQIRIRDWAAAEAEGRTLAPYLTKLNELRRAHPALQLLRNVVVHPTDDDGILCFSKTARPAPGLEARKLAPRPAGQDDIVIVVVNLDPHGTRETTVHLDLPALGLDPEEVFPVHDELSGNDWYWGADNYVRLDPHEEPAHVLTVRLVP